jgi:hypothetical protein
MSSVAAQFRTVSMDNEFYIPVGDLTGLIYALNTNAGAQTFTSTSWCSLGSRYQSSIKSAGAGLLRDVGKTYISSGRTFRKVQLVVPQSTGTVSTFGVNGKVGTNPIEDFLTGYIEIGFDAQSNTGTNVPAPVAKFGR